MSKITTTKAMGTKDLVTFLKNVGLYNDVRKSCSLCHRDWESLEGSVWAMEVRMCGGHVNIGGCCEGCNKELTKGNKKERNHE